MRSAIHLSYFSSARRYAFLVVLGAVCGLAIGVISVTAFADDTVEFKIIVNPNNGRESETREFVADAFLKNVSEWQDHVAIQPVDQRLDSRARRSFSEHVMQRSVAAVRSYWQQRIFSGRGVPPPELDSDQAVVSYVLKHRGAIGYVAQDVDVGKARVLKLR